jgi:hypothetical protein
MIRVNQPVQIRELVLGVRYFTAWHGYLNLHLWMLQTNQYLILNIQYSDAANEFRPYHKKYIRVELLFPIVKQVQ